MVNLVCTSCEGAIMDRKTVFSNKHICELYSWIVCTMVLVATNPLVGLDPVLKDGKVGFKGYFRGFSESFQDYNARATMENSCFHTRDPK